MGANPNARANLREHAAPPEAASSVRERPDSTPLAWGRVSHNRMVASDPAVKLIEKRGGRD